MKRRLFSSALLATSTWLSQSSAWAQALFKPGKDYYPLDRPIATEAGNGKIRHIAYERLIRDAIKGDRTLFVRRDELEQAWAWIDQIHAARKAARAPLLHYPAGCHGPDFE